VAEAFDYKGQRIAMFSAHSEYLDQILRSGLIGLVVFLTLLCVVVVTSFRLKTYPPPLGLAFYGLGFGLVGVAFYSIWHESARYPWFGVIFWLLIGALSSVVARHERAA
jgi:O-antigen ligase